MQVWRRRRELIFGTKAQRKRMREGGREGGRPLWKLGIPYGGGEEREALWEPRRERGRGYKGVGGGREGFDEYCFYFVFEKLNGDLRPS